MGKYTYEGILRVVGQVLDEAEVKSFAIRDVEDGLLVETFDAEGQKALTLNFGLADLVELVDMKLGRDDLPRRESITKRDEGTLQEFLGRRELVSATR